jgi:hypothetical protein
MGGTAGNQGGGRMNITSAIVARLQRHFRYYPNHGLLAWRTNATDIWDTFHRVGNEAVMSSPQGLIVLLDGQAYRAASICWAIYAGDWMEVELDDPDKGLVVTNLRIVGPEALPPPRKDEPPKKRGYVVLGIDWGSREQFELGVRKGRAAQNELHVRENNKLLGGYHI